MTRPHHNLPQPRTARGRTRNRAGAAITAAVVALAAAAGCGPRVTPASLGRVIYDPAELPGADDARPTAGAQAALERAGDSRTAADAFQEAPPQDPAPAATPQ